MSKEKARFLTLDSSVIVAALRKQEEKHAQCKGLLEGVKEGRWIAIEPCTVLVEVVAAIRRRTGSEELAEGVRRSLQRIGTIFFLSLNPARAEEAAKLAAKTGLRGMDAVVVQIAKEFGAVLATLDEEIRERAEGVVELLDL